MVELEGVGGGVNMIAQSEITMVLHDSRCNYMIMNSIGVSLNRVHGCY